MVPMPLAHHLAKLGWMLTRSRKRRLDNLPGGMSRPPCPLLVLSWHHTAYPAWQTIRSPLHRADPIGPQQRQLVEKHIHVFNPVKQLLPRDLLVQLMEHFPLIAQFHPPHMPVLFRPAIRTPHVLKPRLA